MAVSNNYEIKNYILDGIVTQFAIPFDVNVDDYGNAINIVVYLGLDELEKDVDYTISVKTINYPGAVDHAGEKLTVFRRTPIEQPVDFVDNGNFTLEDIETGLDRSIMIEQETSANLDNTIRAQESAERAEQYKDIAIEKASDAEDWAVGTRSDGQTPSHSLESAKHYAESADTSASMATSMRNQSAANALVSEGYAKGTQGGVPVESGDYYQDNSKYYKEQAGLSAGAASGSATSAYNSELAAAASEDKAHDWADKATDSEVEPGEYSAKHWAAKASQSSGSAAISAYNAGLSETAADTSAKDSEAYAVGTRGGTPVTSDDPAYHNNSKWYNDNIAQQTVTPDNAVTLTNKTIAFGDNTMTDVTSTNTAQTLTNKTIAYADNTLTGVQPTLTAGTGIDITGTTISTKQTYSTSEVKTGDVWIDGKPIYKQVFTGTSPATAYSYVSNFITIANVGYIVNFFGEVGNQPINSIRPASDSTINARYTAWITRNGSTGLDGVFGSSVVNTSYTITVEYTKTTD